MPPRYAYWTILIDDQPTAFRATKVEELLPTFNRLKQKNPSAVMMWSQFGKLWKSPEEAMAEGKSKDPRQSARPKPEWKPKAAGGERPYTRKPYADRPKPPAFARGSHLRQGSGGQVGAAGQALSPKPSRPRRVPPKPGSKNWRPGGDHQDPRQKYLDAKKAKWTRFKKAIRDRHEKKSKP